MLGDRMGTVARPGLALLTALALMGCEDGIGLGSGGEARSPGAGAATSARAAGPVDVAAPEIFQVTGTGLWDGRPSLGGVWVAHPDATDPERVRIVNRANGQEVVGALFRRERDLPGPALQVSSDAAEALGMLAGAPAEVEVTALRRQEAPEPAQTEPAQIEPVQTEAAAPEATSAPDEPAPEANPAARGAPAAGAAEAVAQATAAILASSAVAPPAGGIATTTLDAPAGAPASALRSPFVQLGLFDREANATEASQNLAAQGLPARVVGSPGGGSWRLLLGPATSRAEQEALLARAVAAGFEDAYLVRS